MDALMEWQGLPWWHSGFDALLALTVGSFGAWALIALTGRSNR